MIRTLTGNNEFLLHQELTKIIASFAKKHGDLSIERIDGEEASYDAMRSSLESTGLFSTDKLVVFHAPSANKQFNEHAPTILATVSDGIDVVLVEPKLDKRSSYAKWLQKNTEFLEFKELNEQELVRWLSSAAKKKDTDLSVADARYLVDRIGPHQLLLSSELDKLSIAAKNKPITKQLIDELVEPLPQSTTFELLDAAFAKNSAKTLRLYQEQRLLKVEPQQLLAMLGWQLHILAVIKTAGSKSQQEIAKEAHIHPFVVQKNSYLAARIEWQALKSLIKRVLELDIAMKTTNIDADDTLMALLLEISN